MGKYAQKSQLQQQQQHNLEAGDVNRASSRFFCEGCSNGVYRLINLRCVLFLVLGFAVLLSGLFWVLPIRSKSGFDAEDAIRNSASVRAYFRLQKPVSELVPDRATLEREIFNEISLPTIKVAIISMHQPRAANWSEVVFAVVSDPVGTPISKAWLSLLRSSLIEIFVRRINLTLTTSIFGEASTFQILKFPGGITVNPFDSAPTWETYQIKFNFTLNNSISEIQGASVQLKNQLVFGLQLQPYENLYFDVTNEKGSTVSQPVIVRVSIASSSGYFLPERLKQLALIIAAYPTRNLGLDHSVFGRVKSVRLFTNFRDKPPSGPVPAPTPAPEPSPTPSISLLHSTES